MAISSPPTGLGPSALTPLERVRLALAHQQPDRVPTDLWAVPELWQRLQDHFGGVSRQQVLLNLDVDLRWVVPRYVGPMRELPGGLRANEFGSYRREVHHTYGSYQECAAWPLADAQTVADVERWDWPRTEYWDMESVGPQLDALDAQGQFFVCYDVGGIFDRSCDLVGLEQFLLNLSINPDVADAVMARMTDLYIANVTRLLQRYEGRIHMAYTWDDIGHQHALMVSPRMWRQHILPCHQRLNRAIRQFDVKILYHSCGAIYPLIGEFISGMGIDVLNPLQPSADGMDLPRIKREFGDRLAFHGAVDVQGTLPHGTSEEVAAEVRDRCQVLGRGGGYILAPSHAIQNDTPLENVLALYRTSRQVTSS